MATVHHLQPTFAGGEFAPSLTSRVDLAKYGTGLKKAKNFIVHPHGGASNRPGLKYVAAAKYADKKCRLIEFEFAVDESYMLEFGDLYLRIHSPTGGTLTTDGTPVSEGGIPYEVVTPYLEAELPLIKVTQSADVLYIVHPDHAPMTLERYADLPPDWRLIEFPYKNGPFMVSNLDETKTLTASALSGNSISLTSNFDIFSGDHAQSPGALFRVRHQIAGQAVSGTWTEGQSGTTSSIQCGGTWRVISHGSWSGSFEIQKSVDNGSTWTLLRKFTSAWVTLSAGGQGGDFNVNTFGTDEGQYLLRIKCNGIDTVTGDPSLTVDLSSDPYEHTGIVKVTAYTNARSVTANVLTVLGNTTATYEWAEGAWSNAAGFPATVVFFQDRLCFASTYFEPQTTWMSKTGIYEDFGRSTPLEDTDGISVPLPSRKMNGIANLVALGEILALTAGSEWTVGATQGGVVTPTAVDTRVQGYRGSSKVAPVLVGNRIVYVQPMGSVIRDLGYSYDSNGYTGDDLSVFANHLFQGYTITQMAYQQEPDSLVWAVRSDGILLSMTYLREHEVIAWTWHETDGEVESVASIPNDGINEIWLAVKRGSSRFIERMVKRDLTVGVKHQFYVDCGLSYDDPQTITGATSANPVVITCTGHGFSTNDRIDFEGVEGMTELNGKRFKVTVINANSFSLKDLDTGVAVNGTAYSAYTGGGEARKALNVLAGLSHLEGRVVKVLADGQVMPELTVSGGQITLPKYASIVHAGLSYTCDLQTLNIEIRMDDGTAQDRFVKIPEVTLRFLSSRGGWVGPDENHLDEIIQRTNEPLGSPVELQSGDYKMTLVSDYSRGGSVLYRQIDPLPVTILAIMPKVTPGG